MTASQQMLVSRHRYQIVNSAPKSTNMATQGRVCQRYNAIPATSPEASTSHTPVSSSFQAVPKKFSSPQVPEKAKQVLTYLGILELNGRGLNGRKG